MTELKRTPLFSVYSAYGGKTVEFGGWDMPVQFSGIIAEHEAVREKAGLFDVSHMGEFEITGPDARSFLQYVVTNDVSNLMPGRAMYTPMCDNAGGTLDDLLIYCFADDHFWAVVNAGNIDSDFAWMAHQANEFQVKLNNISDAVALLALQGPRAVEILSQLTTTAVADIPYYQFEEGLVDGTKAIISRTGYTGEDGFELYIDADSALNLWKSLLTAGEPYGLVPCGLGARDTLRLEARMPLYGHELNRDISPLEAGIGFAVKLDKEIFVGRAALAHQKEQGLLRRVVGLEVLGRGIPRAGYPVCVDGQEVGFVTSGTMSPTLKKPIALALIEHAFTKVGTECSVQIRDKQIEAVVVKTPFYRRPQA